MSDKRIYRRVDDSLHLPFKEEDLRLTREYLKTLKPGEVWTTEGLDQYFEEHGSPEFKEYLKRVSKMNLC